MWEKLLRLDWRGEAEAGRHSTSCNAAALQAWLSGSPVVTEWPTAWGGGPGGSPQLQEHRAGTSPTTEPVLCASSSSQRGGSVPWVLGAHSSLLGLDCPSGESHGPRASGDLPEGDSSLERRGKQPTAQSWWRGLSCLAVRAAGGSPRVAVERGAVGLMHTGHSGLWLLGGAGSYRESWRPFLCLQLLSTAGPGWAGDLEVSGWAGSSGGGRAGKAVPEGALGGGSTSWKWKSCAPGLSCHGRALSCCSLTAEFAVLSFLAVPPQKCWAGAGNAANRVARGLVTGPEVSPVSLLYSLCGCRSREQV